MPCWIRGLQGDGVEEGVGRHACSAGLEVANTAYFILDFLSQWTVSNYIGGDN